MRTLVRLIFPALLLLSSLSVSASTLTGWRFLYYGASQYSPGLYPSALSACQSYNPNGNPTYRLANQSSTQAWCYRTVYGTETHIGYVHKITENCQFGDNGAQCNASCNAPNVMRDGQCVAPLPDLCTRAKDKVFKHIKNYGPTDPIPPDGGATGSHAGCVVGAMSRSCTYSATGSAQCVFEGKYTGEKATPPPSDDQAPVPENNCEGDACKVPEPELTNEQSQECTASVVDAEGRKHTTCNSSSSADQTGGHYCGQVNGVHKCVGPSPTPESDLVEREDEIVEENTADGGTKTTTTSTTNNTYCKSGSCNTTTTTTTTVVTKDSGGNTTGESSTCKGANCDKPGSGSGDGEGEGEEEGEEGGDMPGSVDGPDIEDALPEIGEDDDPDMSESARSYWDRVSDAPIVAAFTSITVPSGGSCGWGSADLEVMAGSVSFDQICQMGPEFLIGLRFVFLACWAWGAIRLFGTA